MTEESAFQRKLREKREAESALQESKAAHPSTGTAYTDLVPDEDSTYVRSEQDQTIDGLIDGLDILAAYDRWIPKPRPPQRAGKKEGIMVRCPMPNHADSNPSAWINREKQTWYCGGCGIGGDKLDLAAIHFGMGDYKTGTRFGELRGKIAENLGYRIVQAPGAPTTVVPVSTPNAAPISADIADGETLDAGQESVGEETGSGTLVAMQTEYEDPTIALPGLDWRELVEPNTFLDTYMKICTADDVPEEYHFWNGLLCVSMAIGRDITLDDYVPVLGNLFVCIIGRTGSGKSRANRNSVELVSRALPWDPSDPMDRGVKKITVPGSAEALIHQFSRPIYDPTNNKLVIGHAPVRGIVEFAELSGLLGRAGRSGSILKPTLMEFFDGASTISTSSLTSGTQLAKDAFASVITSVQPKALPTLVGHADADSGFLNRWIFASGTSKKRVAVGGTRIDLNPCVEPLRAIHQWAEDADQVTWAPDGLLAYTRFFDKQIEKTIKNDDSGLLGRLDLLTKKLCLLFAANQKSELITPAIVAKVERIYEYLLKVFGIQAEQLGSTDEKLCEEAILEFVRKHQLKTFIKEKSVPLHYIIKILGKRFSRKMIRECIDRLCALHEMESYVPPAPKVGRPPSIRYFVPQHEDVV